MQGRQQQIVAHKMKGMAYPIQLNVRNTIHNLHQTSVRSLAKPKHERRSIMDYVNVM
jgi:hypothetical protein